MPDDLLPTETPSWIRRFRWALGQGLTPEVAAGAIKKAVRTFFQAAIAVVVAAGTGIWNADVAEGAAVAGIAAVASLVQNGLGK